MHPLSSTRRSHAGRRSLQFAAVLIFLAIPLVSAQNRADAQTAPKSLPSLTRADQVRQLSPDEAARGYPVHIRGIITDDVPSPDFFVQDASAGIYVEGMASSGFPHHFGDLVDLEGITGPGKVAPVIREQRLRVTGKG